MSLLQTLEDQIKEYGTYQQTSIFDDNYFRFVHYEMDSETMATIVYRDDDTIESIRFW